jgi:hypothetical protein
MTFDHRPPPLPPTDPEPESLRQLPRNILMTFVRWIGAGGVVGAAALGIVGLWYVGPIGLAIGVVLGAVGGGIAGLLLLFWFNWPF